MGPGSTSFGLAQIGQIAVTAKDLDRAVAFYRDTLGMAFLFHVPNLVIHNVRVFPGNGPVLAPGYVVVRGDRIVAVGDGEPTTRGSCARRSWP